MSIQSYELKTHYDSAKSFYGKAWVLVNGDEVCLKSYNTIMIRYNSELGFITFMNPNKDNYTLTTNRHIKEFLKQYTRFNAMSKKELLYLKDNYNNMED